MCVIASAVCTQFNPPSRNPSCSQYEYACLNVLSICRSASEFARESMLQIVLEKIFLVYLICDVMFSLGCT